MVSLFGQASKKLTSGSWLEHAPLALHVISAGVLVFLVILIVTTPFYINRLREPNVKKTTQAGQTTPALQDLAAYQAILEQHPVFGLMKQKITEPARSACDDFKTKFLLTGIVSGAENEAIFSDRSSRDTRFVKSGDSIENVTVEAVKPQSVVINCAGKQTEIAIEGT